MEGWPARRAAASLLLAAAVTASAGACGGAGQGAPGPGLMRSAPGPDAQDSPTSTGARLVLTSDRPVVPAQLATAVRILRLRFAAANLDARVSADGQQVVVETDPAGVALVRALVRPARLGFRETWTDPTGGVTDPASNPPPAPTYAASQRGAEDACVKSLQPSAELSEPVQTTPAACTVATFETLDCTENGGRPLRVDEDDKHFAIACDRSGQAKYLLAPSDLTGEDVLSAAATIGQTSTGAVTGLWEVDVTFKDSAVSKVVQVSTKLFNNNEQPLAITLDGIVESNPSTDGVLGKNIQISGGAPPFSQQDASNLANALKYGSLPVDFTVSSVSS